MLTIYPGGIERHRSIPIKRADSVLVGLHDRLAKRSEAGHLGGEGSRLIVGPIYNYAFITDV